MPKILVIEDDIDVMDNILDILELEDYDIVSANNGKDGVAQALDSDPDLILCDVMMPQMDGYQVLSALRDDARTAVIPFVFLTAKADRVDQRQGMDLGADDYLTKPFTPRELCQAIATRLRKRETLLDTFATQIETLSTQLEQQDERNVSTGLPNAIALEKVFDKISEKFERTASRSMLLPLCCLKLDRYEQSLSALGETFAHQMRRRFVKFLAKRWKRSAFVAQTGPAEFVAILKPVAYKQEISTRLEELFADLKQQPFEIEGRSTFVSVSAGVALYLRNARTLDQLLRNARVALDKALDFESGNVYEFYSPMSDVIKRSRLVAEQELRSAVHQDEFELYYQPRIDLYDRRVVGCKAQLYWHHPQRGLVPATECWSMIQACGLSDTIAPVLFEQACQSLAAWALPVDTEFRLAIELVGIRLDNATLRHALVTAIVQSGIPAEQLELVLGEDSLTDDLTTAKHHVESLHRLGVKLALRNFGASPNTLHYGRELDLKTIELASEIVRDLHHDTSQSSLVRAAIDLSRQFRREVIADGVSTEAELNHLCDLNCTIGQGDFCGTPVAADEFVATYLKS